MALPEVGPEMFLETGQTRGITGDAAGCPKILAALEIGDHSSCAMAVQIGSSDQVRLPEHGQGNKEAGQINVEGLLHLVLLAGKIAADRDGGAKPDECPRANQEASAREYPACHSVGTFRARWSASRIDRATIVKE